MAAVFALTCAWVVACHDDDSGGLPPKAQTVPNVPLEPLPLPEPRWDGGSETADQSALTIAVDVDPTISADEWVIKATDARDTGEKTFTGRQGELTLYRDADTPVRIEIYGRTTLSNGSDYITAHRVVTTSFAKDGDRMLYLFVDPECAYRGASDGGSGCANEHEWCYEGTCRAEEIAGDTLPTYRTDWKAHPPSPCAGDAGALVRLGEGLTTYAERNDGDTVTIECGLQGGHHIWVAARAEGLDQRNPFVTITSPASDAGAALTTSSPLARLYESDDPRASAFCEAKGVQFQLDPDGRPVQPYLGKPIDIRLVIQDKQGVRAEVTRHLQVAPKLSTTSCFSP